MNPELRRNLWLELTVHRLVALPIVLGLVFVLVRAMAESDPRGALTVTAASLFVGLALWGGVHAADAVMGEVRARTWDGQRMSAIEPWAMTWGKLIGAPAFAWYGGLICLGVFIWASPEPDALKLMLFMLAAALLVHALALIGSVVAARKAVVKPSSGAWVLGLSVILVGPSLLAVSSGEGGIAWWGSLFDRFDFLMACSAVFAAWAVLGAYRLMCQELRVRTLPWVWLAFVLFVSAFIAGFGIRASDTPIQQANVVLIAGLLVSLAGVYPLLFSEGTNAMAVRRLMLRIGDRQWRLLLQETPLWFMTLGLALTFCVLTVLFAGPRNNGDDVLRAAVLAPVPLFLLVARDAGLYMFFALARQPRRTEATTIFYLVLLYWLLPMLLRAAGADQAADFVLPPFWDRPGAASGIAAVQAAIVIAAALWRWRKHYRS